MQMKKDAMESCVILNSDGLPDGIDPNETMPIERDCLFTNKQWISALTLTARSIIAEYKEMTAMYMSIVSRMKILSANQ